MVIDTSALMCVLLKEDGWPLYRDAFAAADPLSISAATLVEAHIVALRKKVGQELDDLLASLNPTVRPFTDEQVRIARIGDQTYGKGRHPAKLNLGDCFAYALAKDLDEPLLFKGEDFSRTDVRSALNP